jgi:hypothetical protein
VTKVAEVAAAAAAAATPPRKRRFCVPPGLDLLTPQKSFRIDGAPAMLSELREVAETVRRLSKTVQRFKDANANDRERHQEHSHQVERMGHILADVMKALHNVQEGINVALGQFQEE